MRSSGATMTRSSGRRGSNLAVAAVETALVYDVNVVDIVEAICLMVLFCGSFL
jgi:hypothetical protein